jgi:hypothetical protein
MSPDNLLSFDFLSASLSFWNSGLLSRSSCALGKILLTLSSTALVCFLSNNGSFSVANFIASKAASAGFTPRSLVTLIGEKAFRTWLLAGIGSPL